MKAPCKDCENRHPSCHSHCEEYKAFRAEIDREREERRYDSEIKAYNHDTRARLLKKTRRRR